MISCGSLTVADRRIGPLPARMPAGGLLRGGMKTPVGREDPLFRRFLERDPQALADVEFAVTRVVRFRGYAIPASDRRDVIQESLLQIWREASRPGFDYRQDFDAFVCLVAFRRCLDWRRARRPAAPIDSSIPDARQRPDEDALAREEVDLARRVLLELPEPCRDLIRLHVQEERPYREIAEMLGRTEGALRTQMWKCLEVARQILERLDQRPRRVRMQRP